MRDDSDGELEGGRREPQEYATPSEPRNGEHAAQAPGFPWDPRADADATPPARDGYQDTIAFGTPPGPPAGQGRYAPPGYGSQPDSGHAWYEGQPGYGNQGSQGQGGHQNQGGYREPGAYRAGGGGYGASGWAMPESPPGRPARGGRFLIYIAVAALAASIGAGATVAVSRHGSSASSRPSPGISRNQVPGPSSNAAGSGSSAAPFNRAAVVKKVKPGLVDITSTLKYNSETAEGTGMIVSSSGFVLTNNHVIDGATVISVTLAGNRDQSYPAQVVGYDAADDVALLRLQGASGLPTESFGNSSQVTLGTPVLALGNAEGRGGATPTVGIINALNRSIQASDEGSGSTEDLNHMLQTSALIQQGDSGGALANNAGQVIGMITAANTPGQAGSGGGLGFAIPINSALAIARQIASGQPAGNVYVGLPGFLGVEVAASNSSSPQQQAADEAQAGGGRHGRSDSSCQTTNQQSGIPGRVAPIAAGALVLGVLCDTAAAAAGMVPGDVITSVGGQPITTPGSLTAVTARYHPNAIVSVIWVSLDGMEHTTRMMMGQGPAR